MIGERLSPEFHYDEKNMRRIMNFDWWSTSIPCPEIRIEQHCAVEIIFPKRKYNKGKITLEIFVKKRNRKNLMLWKILMRKGEETELREEKEGNATNIVTTADSS